MATGTLDGLLVEGMFARENCGEEEVSRTKLMAETDIIRRCSCLRLRHDATDIPPFSLVPVYVHQRLCYLAAPGTF